MREIKFRGLDKKRKELVYGNFHYFGSRTYIIEPGKPGIPEQHIEVEPNSVGQYTGLKDKNGKEIFFDDIILFSFDDSEEQEHYSGSALVVESMNGGAAILHDWDDGAMELVAVLEGGEIEDIWPDEEHWEFEVIGNRWENPELIKTDL